MDRAEEMMSFRDWIADQLKKAGGEVPHRGYATGSGEADLQVIAPDGTELEITMRIVERC